MALKSLTCVITVFDVRLNDCCVIVVMCALCWSCCGLVYVGRLAGLERRGSASNLHATVTVEGFVHSGLPCLSGYLCFGFTNIWWNDELG